MLLTIFTIGGAPYAVDATQVVEVLPLIHIEPIPSAPPAIAGTANYRGVPLVVVDLHRLAGLAPAPQWLSTRILVVQHGQAQVGLLAAGATDTATIDSREFRPAVTSTAGDADWLGPQAIHGSGFIRRIELAPLVRLAGAAG